MANVAISVRRKIIKSIEVSIGSSEEDQNGSEIPVSGSFSEDERTRHDVNRNFQGKGGSRFLPGTTGVARPFVADTVEKGPYGTTEVINQNLFSEKSLNLEIYENLRAPSKILDLRSLLIDHNEDNIIFDLMGNNYEMFEVDQLSGEVDLCSLMNLQKLFYY